MSGDDDGKASLQNLEDEGSKLVAGCCGRQPPRTPEVSFKRRRDKQFFDPDHATEKEEAEYNGKQVDEAFMTPIPKKTADRTAASLLSLLDERFNASAAIVTEVDLSKAYGEVPNSGECCLLLDGLLSEHECQEWIHLCEERGFETALINDVEITEIRNSGRCMIDDEAASRIIYDRIFSVLRLRSGHRRAALSEMALSKDDDDNNDEQDEDGGGDPLTTALKEDDVPPFLMHGEFPATGLNERFRFLRYTEGQYFKPHYDGSYTTPDGSRRSMVTCQIYLNEGFVGGNTNILDPFNSDVIVESVVPKTGRVLLFDHRTNHEGAMLGSGVKYAVRTEIMYDLRPSHRD